MSACSEISESGSGRSLKICTANIAFRPRFPRVCSVVGGQTLGHLESRHPRTNEAALGDVVRPDKQLRLTASHTGRGSAASHAVFILVRAVDSAKMHRLPRR